MWPKRVVVERDNEIDFGIDIFINFNNFYLICFVVLLTASVPRCYNATECKTLKIRNKNNVGCFAQQRRQKRGFLRIPVNLREVNITLYIAYRSHYRGVCTF
jgi:hypothetical protein